MTNALRGFLKRFTAAGIPRQEFEQVFNRSSGPGGQNVNKVNTKATIKYTPRQWQQAGWLPDGIKARIGQSKFPYLTKSGGIVVSSDLTRHQKTNLDDCFNKLAQAIKESAFIPEDPSQEAQERWVKIRKTQDKIRLDTKRKRSDTKKSRKIND